MHYTTRWNPEHIRAEIVACRQAGLTYEAIQRKLNVSRHTVRRWLSRPDLATRSSRPHRQPRRLSAEQEQRIIAVWKAHVEGPHALGARLGVPGSTVHKVLKRHGLNRRSCTLKLPPRRYQAPYPGALVHIDVKKLGSIGLCEALRKRRRFPGHEYLHVAIDDAPRVGYGEVHRNETAMTATQFLERLVRWYASIGVRIERVMTDRGAAYTSDLWRDTCAMLGIRHILIRPRRPQTNGKVERWIRTICDEALHGANYPSLEARAYGLGNYINYYNHGRPHQALGWKRPFQMLAIYSTPGV